MISRDKLGDTLAWIVWYLYCGLCFGGISALIQVIRYLGGEDMSLVWVLVPFIVGMVAGSSRYYMKGWYE